MAYIKHNFKSGDTLYASQLNEMEDQIILNETIKSVLYVEQQLTDTQKTQARANIGAASQQDVNRLTEEIAETIRYAAQDLTDVQKAQARANIGAITAGDVPKGDKGDTPVKGVDYWTKEDKEEIIEELITRKEEISYTNQLPISLTLDGSGIFGIDYNEDGVPDGYKRDTRTSSSGDTAATGWCVTGLIPAKPGDIIRFKNMEYFDISNDGGSTPRTTFFAYDAAFNKIANNSQNPNNLPGEQFAPVLYNGNGDVVQLSVPTNWSSSIAYIRICCGDLNKNSIITVNEEILENVENRILNLENNFNNLESRVTTLENSNSTPDDIIGIPSYWQAALDEGVQAINTALCETGKNKSAFLFYSDVHWDYGSQRSPALLKYLYNHTGMTKTFFGGDIVNNESTDYDAMEYLWEWRKQLKAL